MVSRQDSFVVELQVFVHPDGSVDVNYDDGDKEMRLSRDCVRAKTGDEEVVNRKPPIAFLYCCAVFFVICALCLLFTSCPASSPGVGYCTTSLWSQVAGTLSEKSPWVSGDNGCFMWVTYYYGGTANITIDRNNTMHLHGYTGGGSCKFKQEPSSVIGSDYADNKDCGTMNNWYNQHRPIGSTQTIFVSKYEKSLCNSTSTMSDLFWFSIAFWIAAGLTFLRAVTCSPSASPSTSSTSATSAPSNKPKLK